jgi:release factor glutamine methyltransferase
MLAEVMPGDVTVENARRTLARRLEQGGIENAALDARLLVAHALGLDHTGLVAHAGRVLSAAEREAISALAERRLAGEPVARILGVKEFWSLPLRLSSDTLVPRPETETVVEAALDALRATGAWRELRIVDLGTGSGAILLALLHKCENAAGIGTDISVSALSTARDNARRLGMVARASFVACDLASALRGPFDLVVSNPPYIQTADIATLSPEVRDFDPRRALDGGRDGLDFYRRIASAAPDLLAGDGVLIVELGAGQLEAVSGIMAQSGLVPLLPVRHDLAGIPRALILGRGQEVAA